MHKPAGMRVSRSYGRRFAARVLACVLSAAPLAAQEANTQDVTDRINKLLAAMSRTQAQVEESQRQLDEMRGELNALRLQVASRNEMPALPPQSPDASALKTTSVSTSAQVQEIREQQSIDESQIATHEQTKVESASKYPVKITGVLLFNSFINTRAVDVSATPTMALPGAGTTGATARQTILGFDATGPHLFGARTYADLRVDFFGSSQSASSTATAYAGPYAEEALLRLRTVHAGLSWGSTEAYFSLDRPILSADAPTSLTAVAEPALSWSGNLWTWNPQLGLTHDIHYAPSQSLRLQAALIDVGDAPLTPVVSSSGGGLPASGSEQSRWPGVEARVALYGSPGNGNGNHIGVGGYFSPHNTLGYKFDAWAATLDAQQRLPARLLFSASAYRGAALGGLGAGAYKDYVARQSPTTGSYYYLPLDDVGGWAQLKETFNERWQANAAFGLDNGFADEIYRYYVSGGSFTQNLARNSTATGNVIFSPSAYLLFSLEYRHLHSDSAGAAPAGSNVVGLGVGYKF